jgi:nucleotide-binding universal stress UspA family protein
MGFETILCAVDFSPQSYAALRTAVRLARANGGRLTVLYVEDPLLGSGAAASGYDTALLQKTNVVRLRRLMSRIATPAGLDRDAWKAEARIGQPAHTIVAVARQNSADLIVMGTKGRGGAAKVFFGSVAQAVLRRAPAPVLVVSRSTPQCETEPAERPNIIGGIELGPHSLFDARRMARAAEMIGGQLTLVHVLDRDSYVSIFADDDAQFAAAQQRLEIMARTVGAQSVVLSGRPEDEIAALASQTNAALVILALRRGRGIFGRRQGATTYRVLRSSKAPVLALPPG